TISYMAIVKKREAEKDNIVKEYEESRGSLYNDLNSTFKKDFAKWHLKLDKDLSIKFTNPQVLFATGKSDITPYFQEILKDFLPKYLDVVLQEKYIDKIAEIRIEGHTDTQPIAYASDPYI